ncbi:MAG TPA: L,D-transpeptidase family protein [Thermoanaerobaculia bacterium]|jgi:lipoprotein-anchoring transpeptidase ErfK/SrfK
MRTKKTLLAVILSVAAAACSREEAKQTQEKAGAAVERAGAKVSDALDDVAVPVGQREDPQQQEKERFDEQWRGLESFRGQAAPAAVPQQPHGPDQPKLNVQFVPRTKESFKGLDAAGINAAPIAIPVEGDVSGPSVLKTQVYLDRANFSVGALDGRWGRNSAIAIWWYQRTHGLPATGSVDEATFRSLAMAAGGGDAVRQVTLTEEDVKGPFVEIPEEVYDQAKLDCLCYESLKEKLSERFHTKQDTLDLLNPEVKFGELKAGDTVWVPNVRTEVTEDRGDIARIVISIAGNTFNGYDAQGNLVFHSPTTLGSKYDPSPRETLEIKKVTFDPWFHYQPKLFHEVPDDEPEANLHPGPNSPVGVVWIALSKPHYGIHGTGSPDSIGYASSHGCVRLTNWDAREVGHRVKPGVVVEFVDTRAKKAEQSASR